MPLVTLSDIRLHVTVDGQGPPLLLVHGFPLDHTMWRGQIVQFRKTHRVIVPDLRGFGQSDVTSGTVSMSRFADDLAELLSVLKIDQPVCLCGLSMGGYIAWQFVQRHRDRLGSLILCDTRAAADSEEARKTRHATADRVLKEGPDFLAESMMEKLFAPATREQRPALIAETQQVIRNTSPAGIAAASRGMAERPDVTGRLAQIDVPTLVLVGQHDAISPSAEMKSIADAIPGATFHEVVGAGHMAPLEDPSACNAAIERFLGR